VDATGSLYFADGGNRVRKISAAGIISTVAGGGSASPGDGGPATAASITPFRIALDAAGGLYISEFSRVRKVLFNCNYAIMPTAAPVAADGAAGSVTVTATAGCPWTATSNVSWITITSGGSGSGNGTAGYSVAGNTASTSRSGTTTIAGQTFTVTQAAASMTVSPGSLSFSAWVGTASVPTQSITVSSSPPALAWTAQVSTASGGRWLSVLPAAGTTPGAIVVAVNPAGMAVGSYQGTITVQANTTVAVSVTLNVYPTPDFSLSISPASQAVAPGGLALYTITITASAGFPGTVSLSCSGLPDGVFCDFSPNPAPPGTAKLGVATSASMHDRNIHFTVNGTSGALSRTAQATLTVGNPPAIPSGSVTNGASFTAGASPGSIITIFGSHLTNLSAGVVVSADKVPLPTVLGGVSVTVNGVPAPLFAISNNGQYEQINLQIPYEVTGQANLTIVVTNNGAVSDPVTLPLQREQPGIFVADWNTSAGAVLHGGDYSLVSAGAPAARGEVVLIYCTGLGPVSPAPPTGQPAPASPLSATTIPPVVSFGGVPAGEVFFSGLAPGYVGLYQVNVRIPANAPTGAIDVVIQTEAQASKPVKLTVQ
jgi:uncharacterized protein (TIGR03437 family)